MGWINFLNMAIFNCGLVCNFRRDIVQQEMYNLCGNHHFFRRNLLKMACWMEGLVTNFSPKFPKKCVGLAVWWQTYFRWNLLKHGIFNRGLLIIFSPTTKIVVIIMHCFRKTGEICTNYNKEVLTLDMVWMHSYRKAVWVGKETL